MSSQASPLHDAGISGATMYGSSAIITVSGKAISKIVDQVISKGKGNPDIAVTIPSNIHPETSRHIQDALKAGHPDILTINQVQKCVEKKAYVELTRSLGRI